MPITFPSNPSVNQTYAVGDRTWRWDGSSWKVVAVGRAAVAQATAPSNPLVGQMWFDTENGIQYTYFNDGSSSQWVETGWAGQISGFAAGGDLTGTYPNPSIAAGAVVTADLANSAVTNVKIADNAVSAAKIASSTIARSAGATVSTTVSSTATSFTDITGLSVSIAPSSTSKRVLIVANLIVGSSAFLVSQFRLMRDATAINVNSAGNSNWFIHDSADRTYQIPITFLDAPNTTSATTYKIQWLVDGNTIYLNRRNTESTVRGTSSLQVIEVDAA